MKKILKKKLVVVPLVIIGFIGCTLICLYVANPTMFEIRSMIKEDNKILELGKIIAEKKFISNMDSVDVFKNEREGCYDGENMSDTIRLIERNQRIEDLVHQIKDWERSNEDNNIDHETFPWLDVALSLLKYPEFVKFDYDKCSVCGYEKVKLHFRSPDWTWSKMMGQAGIMVICPYCKRQTEFDCSIMN